MNEAPRYSGTQHQHLICRIDINLTSVIPNRGDAEKPDMEDPKVTNEDFTRVRLPADNPPSAYPDPNLFL